MIVGMLYGLTISAPTENEKKVMTMEIIKKNPIPLYESICPECGSVFRYKACEVSLLHITCPVCGSSIWANTINPVNFREIYEAKKGELSMMPMPELRIEDEQGE